MTAYRNEYMDEKSDDELPPLHERFHQDNDSDDEESPEEKERNGMRYNAKLQKNKNNRHEIPTNNNGKKILFSGTTKQSPTIIINSSNEKCNSIVISITDNSTEKKQT